MKKLKDLTGKRVGFWTIIRQAGTNSASQRLWLCRCVCGTEKEHISSSLRGDKTQSCGCKMKELIADAKRAPYDTKSKEYIAWAGIKIRCLCKTNRDYQTYGAVGIKMFPGWVNSFEAFLKHIGKAPTKKHTIDRINTFGNYEPGNVRWATRRQQMLNRRDNRRLNYDGKSLTYPEWSRITGVHEATIRSRLNKGKSPKEALGL